MVKFGALGFAPHWCDPSSIPNPGASFPNLQLGEN